MLRAARDEGVTVIWDLLHYGVPDGLDVFSAAFVEEQVRWLVHVTREACAAQASGADVRAVTAWALIGLHDWNSLVTRAAGHYEPGVFCLVDGQPCPTLLADAVRALAAGHEPDLPALARPGWWARDERLLYPAYDDGQGGPLRRDVAPARGGQAASRSAPAARARAPCRAPLPLVLEKTSPNVENLFVREEILKSRLRRWSG